MTFTQDEKTTFFRISRNGNYKQITKLFEKDINKTLEIISGSSIISYFVQHKSDKAIMFILNFCKKYDLTFKKQLEDNDIITKICRRGMYFNPDLIEQIFDIYGELNLDFRNAETKINYLTNPYSFINIIKIYEKYNRRKSDDLLFFEELLNNDQFEIVKTNHLLCRYSLQRKSK